MSDDLQETPAPGFIHAEDVAPSAPRTAEGLLAQLSAERAEMLSGAIEYHAYIPSWNQKLVGVFTPLTKSERERLEKAVKRRKQDTKLNAEKRLRLLLLDQMATACRRLEVDGQQVPGAVTTSGFTPEFGAYLKGLKDDPDTLDIVWVAFGKDIEILARFAMKYQTWAEDPTPQGLDADPFGLD